MMPEEWPIAAPAADRNAPPRLAGRDRLATARADFFLDPAARLSEQERALMTAMLHCLIGEIADEIRAAVPGGWGAANDDGNDAIVEALTRSRLVDERALMALLLRRADEERIGTAARARCGRREGRVLQGLVSHDNGEVSAAAMALILARGRRRDRFGQCLVSFDDLAAQSAATLVDGVAAALRVMLPDGVGGAVADARLASASAQILERRDAGQAVEALTASLVNILDQSGALSDDLILAAAHEGEIAFVSHAVSRRAGIGRESLLDELLSDDPRRVAAVFRLAGSTRELCAGLLGGVGDLLGIADPAEAMNVFDGMSEDEVAAARAWLGARQGYRKALDVLGTEHGQRSV